MNNLANNRPKGLSRQAIRIWGLVFVVAGAIGQGVIMNVLLGMQSMTGAQMETMLEQNERNITLAVFALLLQMASACAIPIFTFLLVDGYQRTSSVKNYILRVAGLALVSEIPYNLAMSGVWFDFKTRNPIFAMVLGMVMLVIYHYYSGKKIKNILIRAMVFLLGFVWVAMLQIEHGASIIIMISTIWALRKNRSWQVLGGCAAMFVCSGIPSMNPTYWLAPVIFLAVHFYNEEIGEDNKIFNYAAYPVILLAVGLIAKYAI